MRPCKPCSRDTTFVSFRIAQDVCDNPEGNGVAQAGSPRASRRLGYYSP